MDGATPWMASWEFLNKKFVINRNNFMYTQAHSAMQALNIHYSLQKKEYMQQDKIKEVN